MTTVQFHFSLDNVVPDFYKVNFYMSIWSGYCTVWLAEELWRPPDMDLWSEATDSAIRSKLWGIRSSRQITGRHPPPHQPTHLQQWLRPDKLGHCQKPPACENQAKISMKSEEKKDLQLRPTLKRVYSYLVTHTRKLIDHQIDLRILSSKLVLLHLRWDIHKCFTGGFDWMQGRLF